MLHPPVRHTAGGARAAGAGRALAWAAGLRGEWADAAHRWADIGDPYERALELADSGEVEATVTALRELEDLGAAAGARVQERVLCHGDLIGDNLLRDGIVEPGAPLRPAALYDANRFLLDGMLEALIRHGDGGIGQGANHRVFKSEIGGSPGCLRKLARAVSARLGR